MTSNSGILVTKDNIQRLTVASHTWDEVDEENQIVYHAGAHAVGRITADALGEDIGLVELSPKEQAQHGRRPSVLLLHPI